ncbi:hypothetical protein KBC85_03420 [Candidatus Saccharibacteria bacterium]|nr:hypothetical protein [Candidatus Saccharibacteria bacterium]MDQ5885317.1 hypothetical protein [Patescibacteria group bacterium]MDQ5954002.1 hypothetical protein [Patescibacteria group bacterium]MDQ5958404.1 hypothetical protein [Patescibacteria group bacterium]
MISSYDRLTLDRIDHIHCSVSTIVDVGAAACGSRVEEWEPPRLQPLRLVNTGPKEETTTEGRDLPSNPYPW